MAHVRFQERVLASTEHLEIFLKGSDAWNKWRMQNPNLSPDLSDIDFHSEMTTTGSSPYEVVIEKYDMSFCNLNRVSLRNCMCVDVKFDRSDIHFSDLVDGYFTSCSFIGCELQVSKIGSAEFSECDFTAAKLSYCSAEDAKFTGSVFIAASMDNMSLVGTDFTDATLEGCTVYGISAWDLKLEGTTQKDLYISRTPTGISVPTIELAQFVSLLVNNPSIRDVIETITSKAVLILGRFTTTRKLILDHLRDELSDRGYVPILFDFDVPASRDVTETIITLASLSKFVVADLTEPKSVPQELSHVVPHFPSIPVQPIIVNSEREYGMFEHFQRYPWVLDIIKYEEGNIAAAINSIVSSCESALR